MRFIHLFLLLSITVAACEKPQVASGLHEEVDQIIKPYIYSGSRVGVAVGIYNNGVESSYFYGTKDLEKGEFIDEYTLFEIGSITKTFTSAILAEMEMENKLTRDDELQAFLPADVNVPVFSGKPIRLIHLSNQTSALPYMPDNFDQSQIPPPFDTYSDTDMFSYLNGLELTREPGEKYEYSNTGPGILGYVLAAMDSLTYAEMIRERILEPLGMNSTLIDFNEANNDNIAVGFLGNMIMDQWLFSEIFIGSAGLKSNLNDMMKYLRANLGEKEDTLHRALQETHKRTFSGEYDMGMSWFISKLDDGQVITWHNGGTGGYSAVIGFNLTDKKGVVILTNTQSGQENEIIIAREIMEALAKY